MDMVEIHATQETLQVGILRFSSLGILSSSFSLFIININDYNAYCNHYYIENPLQTPEQTPEQSPEQIPGRTPKQSRDLNKGHVGDSL